VPRPVPTAWANSVSATVKAAMETVGSNNHTVRSEGGYTKSYRAPLIAMLDDGLRTLAAAAPDLPQDGLEPDAMLIHRPQLYHVLWVVGLERLDDGGELFLNAAWAAGSALGWRGRGTFGRMPRRRNISQLR
jgi:hypothetical protein